MGLLEALEKKRGDISIPVFSRKLGVSESTYYRLLKGKRGIGADLERRIVKRFPDLALVLLDDLRSGGDG